jgi:hypothetical protein
VQNALSYKDQTSSYIKVTTSIYSSPIGSSNPL